MTEALGRIRVWRNEPKGELVASFPGDPYLDEYTEYVRADIADGLLEMLKVAQLWLDVDGRYDMQGINAAIAKAEGRS